MKTILTTTICLLILISPNATDMIDSLNVLLQNKDSDGIIKLIEENPSILELRDKNQSSGFMLIAYSGLSSVFEKSCMYKNTFSFHEAIIAGKISILKEYTNSEIHSLSNTHSDDGFTPLSLAAFFDRTDIAIFLLENGADPNIHATNPSKLNALHSAVAKENIDLCRRLLEAGANVNSAQMQNVTALQSATHRGNLELVQLLVENGAEIERKMDNGDSALSIAERDGHHHIFEYLIKRKEQIKGSNK